MSLLYKGITGNSLGKQRKLEAFYEVASGAEELRIRAAANGMLQGLRGGDEKVYEGYEREFITLCSAKGLWSAVGPSSVVDAQANFRDGVWVVGVDIAAGLYRNSDSSGGCYWARLNGFGGTLDDIIANRNSDSIQTVTIASSDAGFLSTRCGTWTKDWMTH
jgi:hypothetical protein